MAMVTTMQRESSPAMSCSNTRFEVLCCGRVLLDRCKIHPQDERLNCTCSDPASSFSVVTINETCRKCQYQPIKQQHAEKLQELRKEQDRLAQVRKKSLFERLKLRTLPESANKQDKRKLIECRNRVIDNMSLKVSIKIDQARVELKAQLLAVDSSTIDVHSMDCIGAVMNDEWILWFTGEEDERLWTWKRDSKLIC